MNRKTIYIISLIGFFLMWGVFGFIAAAQRDPVDLQTTDAPMGNASQASGEVDAAGIPVTGEPEPVWVEVLGFYGLIGLAALCLILALLSFANRSTAPYAGHKGPPSEDTHKN